MMELYCQLTEDELVYVHELQKCYDESRCFLSNGSYQRKQRNWLIAPESLPSKPAALLPGSNVARRSSRVSPTSLSLLASWPCPDYDASQALQPNSGSLKFLRAARSLKIPNSPRQLPCQRPCTWN
jgi:hypothetical protein